MKTYRVLLLIFITALIPRLLTFLYVGSSNPYKFYTHDSADYVGLAKTLLESGIIRGDSRTPVYLFLLALVFRIAGQIPAAIVVQIVFGSLTSVFTFLLSRELRLPLKAGLIAASLISFDPASILGCNLIITETFFTVELFVGLWLFVCYWRKGQVGWLIASALVLASAALTRPVAQFVPIVLLPFIIAGVRNGSWRKIAAAASLFALISGALISSWAYRNYRAMGIFTVSTISGYTLLYFRARIVLQEAEQISQAAATERIGKEIEQMAADRNLVTRAGRVSLENQLAFDIFRRYPVQTLSMLIKGTVILFIDPGFTVIGTMLDPTTSNFDWLPDRENAVENNPADQVVSSLRRLNRLQRLVLTWSVSLLGLIYLGSVMGFLDLWRDRQWFALWLPVLMITYFVCLYGGGDINYRFRLPLIPLFAILAGFGYGKRLWSNGS